MRKCFFTILCWALIVFAASGMKVRDTKQRIEGNSPYLTNDFQVHNIGTLWNTVTNFGRYGDPQLVTSSLEWPGGSKVYYLWEGRFWVGAKANGNILVSQANYGDYEWRASEGSPFEFGPGKSMLDSYVEFDDLRLQNSLGIKVLQRGLSWAGSKYDDFIVYEYDVINVGENTLDSLFIAWVYDCDVAAGADPTDPNIDDLVDFDGWHSSDYSDWHGVPANLEISGQWYIDIVENIDKNGNGKLDGYDEYGVPYGDPYNPRHDSAKIHSDGYPDEWQVFVKDNGDTLLVPRGMSYMYDSDNPETPEEDTGELDLPTPVTGYVGGRLLYTDKKPYGETSDDTAIRPYVHQWWDWKGDPKNDVERYQYMAGIHPFSGGKKFIPNPNAFGAGPFDYRWLLSTGPFDAFAPGDTLRFIYVEAVGKGLRGLRENMDNAMKAYYSGSTHSDPLHPSNQHQDTHWQIGYPPIVEDVRATPAYVAPDTGTVTITAKVSDLDGSVHYVTADIHDVDHTKIATLTLYDDGVSGGDLASGDGIYTTRWSVSSSAEKTYSVNIHAKDDENNDVMKENVASFTTIGPIVYDGHSLSVSEGDTIASPGDIVKLNVYLRNDGEFSTAQDISARVHQLDPFIVWSWTTGWRFENIEPGSSGMSMEDIIFKIDEECPNGQKVLFDIDIKSAEQIYWTDTFEITIVDDRAPILHNPKVTGFVQAGEKVTINTVAIDGAGVAQLTAEIESPNETVIATFPLAALDDTTFQATWTTPSDVKRAYDIDLIAQDNLGNRKEYHDVMGFTTVPFSKTADILLVDDDNYNHPNLSGKPVPYEQYYENALTANENSFDVWNNHFFDEEPGQPSLSTDVMSKYLLAIWETGDTYIRPFFPFDSYEYSNTKALSVGEETLLENYLDQGGRLFLSSPRSRWTNFHRIYLGVYVHTLGEADSMNVQGEAGDPITDGLSLALYGGSSANNQTRNSYLRVQQDFAIPIFYYDDGSIAAVRVDKAPYKAVYFAFGFEGIAKESDRNLLMARIIDWLLQPSAVKGHSTFGLPNHFSLSNNYPNPFNPETVIQYTLPTKTHIRLDIYNLLGERVKSLVNGLQTAGSKLVIWDGTDEHGRKVGSGVYVYQIRAGSFRAARKMLLLQ
ncbi:MAG: T9SS type A sorting domain-containing protein [Calditrichaeota bacterium]|nr:T9SS type A sorting domain-containing protein [Calditrichota bacterium]